MKLIGKVQLDGETLNIKETTYPQGGSPAICLVGQDGGPYCTFSINIPGHPLEPGEVTVKTWFEHEPMRQPMLDTGLFVDTGKRVRSGHAIVEIWRIQPVADQSATAATH